MIVTTYNILSAQLERNLLPTPHLPFSVRLPKILSSLREMVSMNSIIGLQEVTEEVHVLLIPFFAGLNYSILYAPYRGHGNMIAYPNTYRIIDSNVIMLGDLIKQQCTPLQAQTAHPQLDRKGKPTKYKSAYDEAIKKDNALLHIKLDVDGIMVNIFNYHLPLAFTWLPIMGLHVTTMMSEISRISDDQPVILLTDLNNKPSSCIYKYVINNRRDVKKGMYPSPHWIPFNEYHLNDARSSITKDDIVTAYSQDGKGNIYSGCIDYVFISSHFITQHLYQRKIISTIPSQYEGSDHIPIMVELNID